MKNTLKLGLCTLGINHVNVNIDVNGTNVAWRGAQGYHKNGKCYNKTDKGKCNKTDKCTGYGK